MLKDKVAIITGASRGVGKAIAEAFAGARAKVVLAARTPQTLDSVADHIQANGGQALVIPTDVTESDSVENLVAQTLDAYHQLDILVNSAGVGAFGMLVDVAPEDWDKVVDANLKSVYLCSKYALRPMLEQQSGQIINILSIAATVAFEASSAYCAAKAGALALTKVLSQEVRRHNIRVTAVSPGSVHTSFWEGIEQHPDFDRMLTAEHVAQTALFVASQPLGMVIDEVTVTPPDGIL